MPKKKKVLSLWCNNKKGGVYDMKRTELLISQIFKLLDLIETPANQSTIQKIRGLLDALKS